MLRCSLFGLTIAATVAAQSPLTTHFNNNNFGAVGGALYFDLNVTHPAGITITGLDLNCDGTGSIEVYTLVGTSVGNQTNPAAWTLATTGTITGALPGVASPVAIGSIPLPAGSYGMALRAVGVAHHYTSATGTNQNYTTAELLLIAGYASNVAFAAPVFTPRVPNCNIHYTIGASGTLGTNTTLGVGCGRSFASLYEFFFQPSSFDLSHSGMSFLPAGGGYAVLPNVSAYLPPTAAATAVAIGDDVQQVVPLGSAFAFPGGSTTALTVCSNGFVSVGPGNGTSPLPNIVGMLAFPLTAWGDIHDFLPTGGANGNVKFEEVGSLSIFAWDAVVDFGTTTPNTWQIQFDRASGVVTMVWQAMSLMGIGHLVFYSPGGPNSDPLSTDLSAVLPTGISLGSADNLALALAATTRPVTGTSWNLTVTHVPATGVLGFDIFGLADPNIPDLGLLGMPGCPLRTTLDVLNGWPVIGATHGYGLAIPLDPALVNAHVYTASAVFQVPPANAFGAITSNGIDGRIGDQ